jgi:PAS domain S-box-containing protein
MSKKPTANELIQRLRALEKEVSASKATIEELRHSATVKQSLLDDSTDCFLRVDLNRRIVWANKTAAQSIGLSPRDLKGLSCHRVLRNSDEPCQNCPCRRAVETGQTEYKLIHRPGDSITDDTYWEHYGVPVRDETGQITGVNITARNVTNRVRAEQALRRSERRYRNVYDTAPLAFVIWDRDCHITDWNRHAEKTFGWSADEVLGRNFFEFLIPDEARPQVDKIVDDLLQGILPSHSINENLTKDGRIILCEWNNSFRYDAENRVVGGISLALDITEKMRADEKLRESEEKYSSLVENSLTGIYIDQDEKIVFANKKFADIYGYREDELIGIKSWKLVHHEDRPVVNQIRTGRMQGENVPEVYEARGLTKDGKTIWILRRNTRIEYGGRPAILGNIEDITQQKWAEEELHRINEELKDFIHAVSHDLKNPLIAIQGFSARLLKNYREKLGDRGRGYLEHINTSVHRIEVLVADLLTLSRIGRIVSSTEDVSCLGVVNDVAAVIQNRLQEKGIQLSVAPDLPVIRGDKERMYQIFENLLVNAAKFASNVPFPKIEVGYEDRNGFHRFFVRDNGIGIDRKYHREIFEKFRRLKEIPDEEGTGLGLAIVHRIVASGGGNVWVESERGKGATFYFTLPKDRTRQIEPIEMPGETT